MIFYVGSIITIEANRPVRAQIISAMSKLAVLLLFFVQYVYCNTNQNNYIFERRTRNSYYFKLGKNNNEVKVNNRIYFLNHNITDLEYPNGRIENMRKAEENSFIVSNFFHLTVELYINVMFIIITS